MDESSHILAWDMRNILLLWTRHDQSKRVGEAFKDGLKLK